MPSFQAALPGKPDQMSPFRAADPSAVARCTAALDELAVLELTYYAAIAPDQVNSKRLSLDAARHEDQAELLEGIADLIRRMDTAAGNANQNKILHVRGVPKAIRSVEDTKTVVKTFCDALGIELDWENFDPTQWLAALREWPQWKNALTEAGTGAWEKGKPILGAAALLAISAVANKYMPSKPEST
ncbi:hypothetical protein IWX78_000745 [Mycetocola sp. CAN_C7]|uniref:hypothetical protein n=1 Tax=Mycetocola sp. CAN_C7 TaxID=2787724 RepID=UPI0018CBACA8